MFPSNGTLAISQNNSCLLPFRTEKVISAGNVMECNSQQSRTYQFQQRVSLSNICLGHFPLVSST